MEELPMHQGVAFGELSQLVAVGWIGKNDHDKADHILRAVEAVRAKKLGSHVDTHINQFLYNMAAVDTAAAYKEPQSLIVMPPLDDPDPKNMEWIRALLEEAGVCVTLYRCSEPHHGLEKCPKCLFVDQLGHDPACHGTEYRHFLSWIYGTGADITCVVA